MAARARCICLTGFMGAGKTTVGASLAKKLGWRFVDLDAAIEQREGRSIPEIFSADGEPHFRQIESEVLRSIVAGSSGATVIALGGGTFIQPHNRELLHAEGASTVYLEADCDLLHARCSSQDGTRPLLQDPERFRALFEQRQPVYRLADWIVQVADRSADSIADEIAAVLERSAARPAVSE